MRATQIDIDIVTASLLGDLCECDVDSETDWDDIDDFSGSGVSSRGRMAVHAAPPGKRKEIYKYEAPWTVYSMNWSIRPDKRFRLALGSFVEEYNNKVCRRGDLALLILEKSSNTYLRVRLVESILQSHCQFALGSVVKEYSNTVCRH